MSVDLTTQGIARRLRHLDVMERITQISLSSQSLEDVLDNVLKVVVETFGADRAWFLYPCDPDATLWSVPMEHTRPEWPGLFALGVNMPMNAEVARLFREMLPTRDAVQYGPSALPVPESIARNFSVKSGIQIVLRPKIDKPWLFGMHHCGQAFFYDENDLFLFTAIAQRITDNLSSLISVKRLSESEEKFRDLFQNSPIGLFHSLPEGRFLIVNPSLARMLGYASAEELLELTTDIGRQIYAHPQQHNDIVAAMLGKPDWTHAECAFRRKNGDIITVNLSGRKVASPDGTVTYLEVFVEDITEKKRSEELIWKQANFDHLTQLPNRGMLHDRLQEEIKRAHRTQQKLALLFIDLDRFKEVNDTLGHHTGDIILVEAARRVVACVRESDTVARLGGDEFTVILSGLSDPRNAVRVSEKIIHALCQPFHLEDETVYISASIGITHYPADATKVDHLLRNADQAMYAAKGAGRNRYSQYTPALQKIARIRQKLVNDLRKAISEKQFRLYFQPIVNLATGHVFKAEALLRWQLPERGLIGPDEFIPIAEETGMIVDIGEWVFKEAARWTGQWVGLCPQGFQVSVNVSPLQFLAAEGRRNAWPDYLHSIGLSGRNIVVEITESLLLNVEHGTTDQLVKFRDAGIQVAIDDFGTGYSALSYLKKFDIDYLKIDQSFVRNLPMDTADMVLTEAIIVMAHKLGLKVIAEGVETERQRSLLIEAGCDFGQGYLFSRAVPPEKFERLLIEQSAGHVLPS